MMARRVEENLWLAIATRVGFQRFFIKRNAKAFLPCLIVPREMGGDGYELRVFDFIEYRSCVTRGRNGRKIIKNRNYILAIFKFLLYYECYRSVTLVTLRNTFFVEGG
jgi:hypothetical protein